MQYRVFLKSSTLLLISLLTLLLLPIETDAQQQRFIVRTVYFKPADAPANHNINNLMEQVEQFYRNEMHRHGFIQPMFKLERDLNNNVIVHVINGRHNAQHYTGNTYEKMKNEIPFEFLNQNNVHVYIVGGLEYIDNRNNILGAGWHYHSGTYGGYAIAGANIGQLLMPVVAHELGHAFGLLHNISDALGQSLGLYTDVVGNDFLMGPGNDKFAFYEARWLSKHHFFNEQRIFNSVPVIGVQLPADEIKKNVIRLQFRVQSVNELFQIQVYRPTGAAIIGWNSLNIKNGIANIDVARWNLLSEKELWVQLMDVNGNFRTQKVTFSIPSDPVIIVQPPKNPEIEEEEEEEIIDEEEEEEEIVDEEEEEIVDEEEEENLAVSPKSKLTTLWATMKDLRQSSSAVRIRRTMTNSDQHTVSKPYHICSKCGLHFSLDVP